MGDTDHPTTADYAASAAHDNKMRLDELERRLERDADRARPCTCETPMATSTGRCGFCGRMLPNPPADIFDATAPPPGVEQLPAVHTTMTPDTFKEWLAADGDLFVVYLPDRRSFIIKVPTMHNAFFVAMMQQVRFVLGPEVQAVRMTVVTGGPPEVDETGEPIPPGDGKAAQAPNWARSPVDHEPPTEHVHHQPGMEPAPSEMGVAFQQAERTRARCPGSQQPAVNVKGDDRSCWRGDCQECGANRKLTWAGNLPGHNPLQVSP